MRLVSARPCLWDGSEVSESLFALALTVQSVEMWQAVLRALRQHLQVPKPIDIPFIFSSWRIEVA